MPMSPAAASRPDGETATLLAVLVQKVDSLSTQVASLGDDLKSDYVRKDVFLVQLDTINSTQQQLRVDLDAIVEQQRQNRRLALSGIVLPVLTAVIAALLLAALLP